MVCGLAGNLEQVWLMVDLPTRPRVSAVTTRLTLVFNQHPTTQPPSSYIYIVKVNTRRTLYYSNPCFIKVRHYIYML